NLFITGLDPMLAGFATTGGQVIDPDYQMNPACNWWFMIASTFVMTFTGWAVTSFFVERRLQSKSPDEGGPPVGVGSDLDAHRLTPLEIRGLWVALATFAATLGVFLLMIVIRDGALNGPGNVFERWVEAIVPMLFFCFVIPGAAFGVATGTIRNDKDAAKLLIQSMAAMAPIIVLAFFAAQFIEYFKYSGLDRMLAMAGGQALGQAEMPAWLLVVVFILLTVVFNLFIGSMSAKYAMFAPIFIPMFMLVGISPELTQAAYRIGDSVSNTITPLNAYLVIILVFMQQYVPKGGMGTLISTMLPYSVVFTIVWTALLLVWMLFDIPLGPDGPLRYVITGG
ncbi:MAG: AbgT family transporter, partial [Phycisphaerales bacterium]|nr:AbgT family transporter [Phycisphaerales bacterium]